MATRPDGDVALERAGEAFARADLDEVVAHLSAAVRAYSQAGEVCQAAMACVRLGEVLTGAMGNLTAGRAWFARARRLVEGEPPCVEQGWVAVAAMGCEVDDPDELLASAELALDRARRFGDVNLETKALADAGLAHVQAGRVATGMQLLDEAMALACDLADDMDSRSKSVCSFFTACYSAGDFGRADAWTDRLRQRGLIALQPGPQAFLSGHCDSVQAALLVELGQWGEAEAVLVRAIDDFERLLPIASWHPAIGLADLRVRQGRFAEAEVLLLHKEQWIEALLPAARLHLARGDHDLARAAAQRGLRAVRADDRLRAIELLAVLVDAELGRGDLAAAAEACAQLTERAEGLELDVVTLRSAATRSRVQAAHGDSAGAIATLEAALDRPRDRQPWRCALLLLQLARLREQAGDHPGADLDARAAAAVLAPLDVVLSADDAATLARHALRARTPARTASLARDGSWCLVTDGEATVRLPDTKGFGYLAELVARPGVEQHVLDLVDRIEGALADGPDRRAIGDAGALLDSRARTAYRQRIEALRAEADEAIELGQLERADAIEAELDVLVQELARAFGLGGRDRQASSTAERARLNVTRALRTAINRLVEVLPEAGAVLDRRVRTGRYCAYEPGDDDPVRWIVQSGLNEIRPV